MLQSFLGWGDKLMKNNNPCKFEKTIYIYIGNYTTQCLVDSDTIMHAS